MIPGTLHYITQLDAIRGSLLLLESQLAAACAALEKIKNYTPHDELYFGSTALFADVALNRVAKMGEHEAGKGRDNERQLT